MRLVIGFKAFDILSEQESLGFHDRPRRSLADQPLYMTEGMYRANPEVTNMLLERTGMRLELINLEQYSKDVGPTDTFLVLDSEGEVGCKVWFGYWEPFGCKFLRERGGTYPHCWVTPQILDTHGTVIRQGSTPGMVANSPDAARMFGCDVPPGKVWPDPNQLM